MVGVPTTSSAKRGSSMSNNTVTSEIHDRTADLSVATAGLIAGIGLLLMAVISFVALPILEGFAVPGDAAATASNIAANETQFRGAIAGVLFIIVLDVVVAWALYVFLSPVSRSLSLLAMSFRLVYAAVFAAALADLLTIVTLLNGAGAEIDPAQLHTLVALNYDAFMNGWDLVLAISGFHLLVVGYLVLRSKYVPNVVGGLLVLAGLGYIVDNFAVVLLEGYSFELTMFTFVGEVVLLVWLLYRGRTIEHPGTVGHPK